MSLLPSMKHVLIFVIPFRVLGAHCTKWFDNTTLSADHAKLWHLNLPNNFWFHSWFQISKSMYVYSSAVLLWNQRTYRNEEGSQTEKEVLWYLLQIFLIPPKETLIIKIILYYLLTLVTEVFIVLVILMYSRYIKSLRDWHSPGKRKESKFYG